MSQRGTKNWVICCAGNIKGAVPRWALCCVSDQECRWEWSGLTALENNTGRKNAQRNGNSFELQGTAHSWRCRQLFRALGEAEGSLWLFPTFSGRQEGTREITKFCYQNYNISENSSRKLLMDPIPLGRFHSHSSCFLQELHEAVLRWISIFRDQLGYVVLSLLFFSVKPITQHP